MTVARHTCMLATQQYMYQGITNMISNDTPLPLFTCSVITVPDMLMVLVLLARACSMLMMSCAVACYRIAPFCTKFGDLEHLACALCHLHLAC